MKRKSISILLCMTVWVSSHGQDTLRLRKYFGNLKVVEVIIQDKKYDFLFDTGGGETFITPEIAARLNRKIYGNVTGFRMSGEPIIYQKADSVFLKLGSVNVFHETIGVWDIMSLLPKDFPRLDGVLSLKSFKDLILTINLAENYLLIETPKTLKRKVKQLGLLQSRFASGLDGHDLTIFLGITKKSHPYWFLFDSGNLNDVLLSHTTAFEWGLQSDTVKHRKELSEIALPLGSLNARARASSTKLIYDGALNFALLSQFVFTIDFPKKKVWACHLTARNPK